MSDTHSVPGGLSLAPFRAVRYAASDERLGSLLCPPYDVIDRDQRQHLLARDPDNAVRLVLPVPPGSPTGSAASGEDKPYRDAAVLLEQWVRRGTLALDEPAALYVYEMSAPAASPGAAGPVTRGLLGALELRDPSDGVILPHENTMAGPVADRLALMEATQANLEPIYLVYDGGGEASRAVAGVRPADALCSAVTEDGTRHRLWRLTDPGLLDRIGADLATRRALIADGHHRYATYLRLNAAHLASDGPGPWQRGLALLVDTSAYGPQVHAIHRVIPGLSVHDAIRRLPQRYTVADVADVDAGLLALHRAGAADFRIVLSDGRRTVVISAPRIPDVTGQPPDLEPAALVAGEPPDLEPAALVELDVTVLHRVLIARLWAIPDDEEHVGYAHSVAEALAAVSAHGGCAVLLRPTPVAAVAAVAAAGARMPRKSTLFTPKPASGLALRRFVDEMPASD